MLAVMVVIFLFSGQQGEASAGVSNGVGEWLLGVLGIEIPPGMSASNVPIIFGLTVRKLAHIFLYFLLGGTSFLFAATLPVKVAAKAKPAVSGGIALVISLLYACLDEIHQAVIDQIPVAVVLTVIYMDVPECVDIEIHLVVGTHAVPVYPYFGKLGEYIVD